MIDVLEKLSGDFEVNTVDVSVVVGFDDRAVAHFRERMSE